MDCNKAIINNALQTLNSVFSLGSLENALGSMPNQPVNTIAPPINIDPGKLAKLLNLLSTIDFTGKPRLARLVGHVQEQRSRRWTNASANGR
jgi:hypothetical protein